MSQKFWYVQIATWTVAGCVALGVPAARAQAQSSGFAQEQQDQNQKAQQNGQKSAPQQSAPQQSAPQQQNGNPFPGEDNSAPVLPTGNTPEMAPGETSAAPVAPAVDRDPVRSPDDANAPGSGDTQGFSSSSSGLDNLLKPPDDTDTRPKKGGKGDDAAVDEAPRETPKEDVDVGNYYMDRKDWKGALSRFQSALVLAPDNPDVYWGLAESERHLGQYAEARGNYLKVMEYDPDSHHAKEAKKALKDPEIANAKAPAGSSAR
jgi:tetratricopeptide (TPR) repeat protein